MAAILGIVLLSATPVNAAPCGDGSLDCGLEGGGGSRGGGGGGNAGGGGGGGGGNGEIPTVPTDEQGLGGGAQDGGNAGEAPAPPATLDLAESARSTAQLPVPTVHTAPSGKTYVRIRTALWVDGFTTVATEPITVGAQTVQATATPKAVVWRLGETTLTCNEAGSKGSTSCGYTYQRSSAKQPGGAYRITATIVWSVNWTCTGAECDAAGGALSDLEMTSVPTPLTVTEIQTKTGQ